MFSKENLDKIKSSWVTPYAEILLVPSESHDDYLPPNCITIAQAENSCVKVSCWWGWDADVSFIWLPRILSVYQAQFLVKLEDTLNNENKSIKDKVYGRMVWEDILEMI